MKAEPSQPEARNVVEFRRSELSGVNRPKTLPTKAISVFAQNLTMGANAQLQSGTVTTWTPSGTAALLITKLHLTAKTAERVEYTFADRNGTLDSFPVGTAAGAAGAFSPEVFIVSNEDSPIMVAQGTLNVYNTGGSTGAGTFNVSWHGVQR